MRHGVILAGGGGTRLWPASRRALPKQFLRLTHPNQSLLQATASRLQGACDEISVVTAAEQASEVLKELPALPKHGLVAEPSARNTAAALGLAALHLLHRDDQALMAAIPADQHIADTADFQRVVGCAFEAARESDVIVTVGIVPTRPETGFGYLLRGGLAREGTFRVERFVEKPDLETAEGYLADGNYLWNAGMFFTKASLLLEEIREHMPETGAILDQIAEALGGPDAEARTAELYPKLPSVSIDYGVMEKSSKVWTIPGDFGWSDVGSWSALSEYSEKTSDGNICSGTCVSADAQNNILVADEGSVVAVAGVSDLVVVKHGDAVLVVPKERVQDVKLIVDQLKAQKLDRFL